MLSYRHAFHAGNHADVLKHLVLLELLDHFRRKEKPFTAIDTHAGAGLYRLDAGYATKNAEFAGGIGRLWGVDRLPGALASYVAAVRACNPDGELRCYPGSPWLAGQKLRREDKLWLFELHPADRELLEANFAPAGRQVKVEGRDGFAALAGLLPPPSRRGLVLIDPSYEEKRDYERVAAQLAACCKRFAGGTYVVWYPRLSRAEAQGLPERFRAQAHASWLQVELCVQAAAEDGFGMYGSGLFIVNPPYTLPATLAEVLPVLVELLGRDGAANHTLAYHIP